MVDAAAQHLASFSMKFLLIVQHNDPRRAEYIHSMARWLTYMGVKYKSLKDLDIRTVATHDGELLLSLLNPLEVHLVSALSKMTFIESYCMKIFPGFTKRMMLAMLKNGINLKRMNL